MVKLVSCHAKLATGVKVAPFVVSVRLVLGVQKEVNVTGLLENATAHRASLDQDVKTSAHLDVMEQTVD